MTYARKEIYNSDEVGVYHCISRCVRRAFLCGKDALSGKSFEHRRNWIEQRLGFLTQVFSVEVVSYAVMSNHLHSVLRNRPDTARSWTDEEVAIRWRILFPKRRFKGLPAEPSLEEIKEITDDKGLVKLYRQRLSDISWFNRCLNENIARRANKEDDCKGRFWEGRFKCQRLYDVGAIVACSVYVDLNPIRAGISKTPEQSDYTSVQARLINQKYPSRKLKVPLVSMEEITEKQLSTIQYLELVDATGRLVINGKGRIPDNIGPLLERLNISPKAWLNTTKDFKYHFKRVVGPAVLLEKAAQKIKKAWFHGLNAARTAFA